MKMQEGSSLRRFFYRSKRISLLHRLSQNFPHNPRIAPLQQCRCPPEPRIL